MVSRAAVPAGTPAALHSQSVRAGRGVSVGPGPVRSRAHPGAPAHGPGRPHWNGIVGKTRAQGDARQRMLDRKPAESAPRIRHLE